MTPEELITLRESQQWSRSLVASMLGVSVQAVGRWENGVNDIPPPVERLLYILATNATARQQIERFQK